MQIKKNYYKFFKVVYKKSAYKDTILLVNNYELT
jgi:hypothetical protein